MDDVIINKISIIKNCIKRIKEEYEGHEDDFDVNYTRQDSIILNLQRACEASIDLGTRIIRIKQLGIPQSSRDIFNILEQEQIIPTELGQSLQAMVGFRNIAVHNYQQVSLIIVHSIIETKLNDFIKFIECAQNLS